jgi:hypothetical protein
MERSRLGPVDSTGFSEETSRRFGMLFERDAFLFWDLYKAPSDPAVPPLSPLDYSILARKTYEGTQPVLSYPAVKVRLNRDGNYATAFLTKINQVMDPAGRLLRKNSIKLQVQMNLSGEDPLIQNIFKDTRPPVFRTFAATVGVIPWSNVIHSLRHDPQVELAPNESYHSVSFTTKPSWEIGGMIELRINRTFEEGLIFSTGIRCSGQHITSSMSEYRFLPWFMARRPSASPVDFFTYRSPEVTEDISLTRIEIPILLKSYFSRWAYLKAGTILGYATASSDVQYTLIWETGGFTPPMHYDFPEEHFIRKAYLAIQLSGGIEKQFGDLGLAIEPAFSYGMNPLSGKTLQCSYRLDPLTEFHSILETVKMPAFEVAFGIRILVSYIFK